jgi:hypothetical protein
MKLLSRILQEGYGPGVWHGADIKAAIADVPAASAFQRPAPGRHNIAEIALHHAYYVHSVRGRIVPGVEPFVLEGDDWFVLDGVDGPGWGDVQSVLASQYERLAAVVAGVDAGTVTPALSEEDTLQVILGITCHSAYHAGQVQLIKVLAGRLATV